MKARAATPAKIDAKSQDEKCVPPDAIPDSGIRSQLEKILSSDLFRRSRRLIRFLRYAVEQALAGNSEQLKEFTLATEVFDKPQAFDTRTDPIVRVEARRLRSKLLEYYSTEGKADPVLIHFGRRGYVPKFELQAPSPEAGDLVKPKPPGRARRSTDKPKNASGRARELTRESAIAVLPFVDMSRKGELEHFCDGLSEELTNALTRVRGLQVVSRSSAFQFKGPAQDVRQVGERLGAGVVLEGSVRKARNKLRITAQLANVGDGFHLWSETYDANLSDEFKVQEEIAAKIVETLEEQQGQPIPHALTKKQTSSAKAYRQYLKGLYHRNLSSPHDLAQGVECFEAAIREDPNYSEAYAGLANCWCKIAWLAASPPSDAWPKAKAAALKASEVDETIASGWAALGTVYCAGDWNWAEGERAFLRAIELDEKEFTAHHWYAITFLAPRRRLDEALESMRKAVELGPQSLYAHNHIGLLHLYRGETREAIQQHQEVLKLKPDFVPALWDLGRAYVQESMFEKAETALNDALKFSGGHPFMLGSLGYCHARMGKKKEAQKIVRDLAKLSKRTYVPPLALVLACVGLGDLDRAFEWLQKAVEDRSTRLIELDVDPMFECLREDSKIEQIRKEVCLDVDD